MLKFYNTLTRKKQIFKPLRKGKVGLYTCGPTVYWFAHIGNLRTYIFEDILKRVLEYNGYKVKHVMNITDVGHLISDADSGEDKIEVGAKREKKTTWEIAKFYTNAFKKDLKLLNIKEPNIWIKATDTIKEQIELIKILEKKGFTYKIPDGIYFNTKKLKKYGRLWPKKMKIKAGARVEMVKGKKNPTDFALWKLTPLGVKRQMEWDSPWGRGFPGWHTECVVMAIKNLGIPFDIHCGGIDHILIHHTNEIAQSEAAYGKLMARYWLHGEFLKVEKRKMAKSKGSIIILDDLVKKEFNPLAYRYLCLSAHYRQKLNFTFKGLEAAENGLERIKEFVMKCKNQPQQKSKYKMTNQNVKIIKGLICKTKDDFEKVMNDDLNTPKALAVIFDLIREINKIGIEKLDKELSKQILDLLDNFDSVLGLNFLKTEKIKIPEEILKLAREREELRKTKQWEKADEIRKKIEETGYKIEDMERGAKIKKI